MHPIYHPQMDGLVERFNRTMKHMLRKVINKDGQNWDTMLPYLMSTGFSLFELLYGRQPCGILDLAREDWQGQTDSGRNIIEHVVSMRERIERVTPIVRGHLEKAQAAKKTIYNQQAKIRQFQSGDRVMLLVPTPESKLFAKGQPFSFKIEHRAGSTHGNADGLCQVHCLLAGVAQYHGFELRGGICGNRGQIH